MVPSLCLTVLSRSLRTSAAYSTKLDCLTTLFHGCVTNTRTSSSDSFWVCYFVNKWEKRFSTNLELLWSVYFKSTCKAVRHIQDHFDLILSEIVSLLKNKNTFSANFELLWMIHFKGTCSGCFLTWRTLQVLLSNRFTKCGHLCVPKLKLHTAYKTCSSLKYNMEWVGHEGKKSTFNG